MTDRIPVEEAVKPFVAFDRAGTPYWNEWNFYACYPLFDTQAQNLHEGLAGRLDDIDCVVALSKSGFPLGSWFSLKLGKPLFLFTIGELFHPNGASVIGIYPEGEIPFRRALVVDSHVNTGMTYRLFTKVCAGDFDKRIFAVVIDVRGNDAFRIEDPVFQLRLGKEVRDSLLKIKGVDDSRLADSGFWMREEEYWLSEVEDLDLEVQTEGGVSFEGIGDDGLERKIRESMSVSYLDKWRSVAPLKLYQSEIFAKVLDRLVGWMGDLEVDTLVASSLGAVPLAVGLCGRAKERGKKVSRFIFLGNGTARFYETLFKGSRNVLICDDMVASGGLIYRIYAEFIRNRRKLVGVVAMFNQQGALDKKYLTGLPREAKYLALLG